MALALILLLPLTALSVQGLELHTLMSPVELHHYFGVHHPSHVDSVQYQVVEVENTLHTESRIAKRNGEQPPDAAYKVNVFGNTYNLRLKRNGNLLARDLVYTVVDGPRTKDIHINNSSRLSLHEDDDDWGFSECDHFIGFDAAISDCGEEEGVQGFIWPNNLTMEDNIYNDSHARTPAYEILPLPKRMINLFGSNNSSGGVPHLAKMAAFPQEAFEDKSGERLNLASLHNRLKRKGRRSGNLFIETGLFLDAAAFQTYKYFYTTAGYPNPDQKIRDLLLSFMNAIQAVYHFPSLGTTVQFSLVKLEIQKTQPADLPTYDGERGRLLTSFCNYQGQHNPDGDGNPHHWDIGLYVSGLDFFAFEGSRKNTATMGLATVTGICTKSYGCVIGEMGVRSPQGKPYPSTGFTSVYVMAHEIGHNLGMSHDSSGNACDSNGFIMSPSRGTKGETVWSSCSRDHMAALDMKCLEDRPATMGGDTDHNKYNNVPGQSWNADLQCKNLLFDNDARMDHTDGNIHEVCYSLKCRSPNRIGYYRSGPALEGTNCGRGKVCQAGNCVTSNISPGPSAPAYWSPWKFSKCNSGCIVRSKGYVTKTRTCITPQSSSSTCSGHSKEVNLCHNPECGGYVVASNFADKQCRTFRKKSNRLKLLIRSIGKQPKYKRDRVDTACTIHCRMTKNGAWYAPVLELNDLDTSVYFPDGTWCHNDGDSDYYCRDHQCVSSHRGARAESLPDLGFSNNARPDGDNSISQEVEKYFTLDEHDEPLSSNAHPKENNEAKEEEWHDIDYINIP